MKGQIIQQITPQNKIVGVNNKFGNTNIKNQQGTTRVIFDSLPLDGSTELRFFENHSKEKDNDQNKTDNFHYTCIPRTTSALLNHIQYNFYMIDYTNFLP
jgi:hypothetical protein